MKITWRHPQELQRIGALLLFVLLGLFIFLTLFSSTPSTGTKEASSDTVEFERKTRPKFMARNLNRFMNEDLLSRIRPHLTPPAGKEVPYNLSVSYPHYGEHDQYHRDLLQILKMYNITENGFFIEAGALDGHYLSHTLDLERDHGWSGLLVEASPSKTKELRSKKRKCWSADVCLTGEPYKKFDYISKKDQATLWKRGNGKINPVKSGVIPRVYEGEHEYVSEGTVECFSLFSLLTALKVSEVDLLVLDIEGHEFDVLGNFPFDMIPIKVIAVEHWLMPLPSYLLKWFMIQHGYDLVYEGEADYIFVRKWIQTSEN